MSSSFGNKNDLELEDIFSNVSALYYILKSGDTSRVLKRAEMKQGRVASEPVDFLADYEIKAKRVLNPTQYRLLLRYASEGTYERVPKSLKQLLGKTFLQNDLNFDGAYKSLYWQAKNNRLQDRNEPMSFPEEAVNAEDILNG